MIDHTAHFRREVLAFERAVRPVGEAPVVPSCPGWTVTDLIMHLGWVHRFVAKIVDERLAVPPEGGFADLPGESSTWPDPAKAPNPGPVPGGLVDWFADGAARLGDLFAATPAGEPTWTWSSDHTAGFWARMQAIEAALHRWDAQLATGTPDPMDPELAVDAVGQTFEVMAPARRRWKQAPPGQGERYLFRQTDGPGVWQVAFDGDEVLTDADGPADAEVAGTASDLMLFLWRRIPAEGLGVTGDVGRYFELVPPL